MKKSRSNYGVYAIVNGRTSYRTFVNEAKAQKYISDELYFWNLQTSEVITTENRTEYYCNDCSRFIITPLA